MTLAVNLDLPHGQRPDLRDWGRLDLLAMGLLLETADAPLSGVRFLRQWMQSSSSQLHQKSPSWKPGKPSFFR